VTGLPSTLVADLFRAACLAELDALKPGNVHVHVAGHGMTVADFVTSAEASAPLLANPNLGVGERILAAVEATRAACGQNTNLGILLLCAPLAAAATRGGELLPGLTLLLSELDCRDADFAYRAIRLASPAGLGRSERHDVAAEPTVTLLAAMREAADRDRIAAQYASGFADVFEIGVATLLGYRNAGWPEIWATAGTYVAFLATFPDTHVARKHGVTTAVGVQAEAQALDMLLRGTDRPESLFGRLMTLDRNLKRRGINPGTSADLTVASHFAAGLAAAIAAGSSSNHREIQS
jgi:triphosphoribosyl-dephospho-CoA synthase